MAAVAEDIKSPVIANLVAIAGFVLIFTTFATESAWSWIIGGILLLAGGLWAGLVGQDSGERSDERAT